MKCRSEDPGNGRRCRQSKSVPEVAGLKGEIVPEFRDELQSLQLWASRFLSPRRWVSFSRSQLACRCRQPVEFSSQELDDPPQLMPAKILFGGRLRFLE